VNGKKHGRGVLTQANGDVYEGHWKDGKREGRGVCWWGNGDAYEGEWKNDKIHGKGLFISKSGDKYEGEYKNGKREGEGLYRAVSGDSYKGHWKNDKMEGMGVYKWKNGDVYEGNWKNDKIEEKGVYQWRSGPRGGDKYEGEYKSDKMEGKGKYWFGNGLLSGYVYEGEFKKDTFNGQGILMDAKGVVVQQGTWDIGYSDFKHVSLPPYYPPVLGSKLIGCFHSESSFLSKHYKGGEAGGNIKLALLHAISSNKKYVAISRNKVDGHVFAFDSLAEGSNSKGTISDSGCWRPCLDLTQQFCGCSDNECPNPLPKGETNNRRWVVYERSVAGGREEVTRFKN
jgi:hypothetical protein